MSMMWSLRGHLYEGRLLEEAIALAPGERSVLQCRLLIGRGFMAHLAGDPAWSYEAGRQALEIAEEHDDDTLRGRCLVLMAYGHHYSDFSAAAELADRAEEAARRAGDEFTTDWAMVKKALVLHQQDRHPEALELARRAFARAYPRGNRPCASFARHCEAYSVLFAGDMRRGVELMTEAVRIAEPLGDFLVLGNHLAHLAWFTGLAGDA
ncbi:hypothetical protein ACFQ07_12630, partial [Actinomadura adrarensis]